LGSLFGKLKKRPGKARILASVVVETEKEQKVKIVFVRHRQKPYIKITHLFFSEL